MGFILVILILYLQPCQSHSLVFIFASSLGFSVCKNPVICIYSLIPSFLHVDFIYFYCFNVLTRMMLSRSGTMLVTLFLTMWAVGFPWLPCMEFLFQRVFNCWMCVEFGQVPYLKSCSGIRWVNIHSGYCLRSNTSPQSQMLEWETQLQWHWVKCLGRVNLYTWLSQCMYVFKCYHFLQFSVISCP